MATVVVRVEQASLAHTLGAMREWLDSRRCTLSHFRHGPDAQGIIVISIGFAATDDVHAEEFLREFGG